MDPRNFLENYQVTDHEKDPLPIKVLRNAITKEEIPGQAVHWGFDYLDQRSCPLTLTSHILEKLYQEVHETDFSQCIEAADDTLDGSGGGEHELRYEPLKLMRAIVKKLDEICLKEKEDFHDSVDGVVESPDMQPHVYAVSYNNIKNSRRFMEDRMTILPRMDRLFKLPSPISYFAVFDGHNGSEAAAYGAAQLHQYLIESFKQHQDAIPSISDAFESLDEVFIEKCRNGKVKSGSTVVLSLIMPGKLYVAWLGDSQAVLVKRNEVNNLVTPHKPERKDEIERIRSLGGEVIQMHDTYRVNGNLAVSRAIGDADQKTFIISTPDIKMLELDGSEEFLILACDGLWDEISPEAAANIVRRQVVSDPSNTSGISQKLIQQAKQRGSQDNISVIVVFLEPIESIKNRYEGTLEPESEVEVTVMKQSPEPVDAMPIEKFIEHGVDGNMLSEMNGHSKEEPQLVDFLSFGSSKGSGPQMIGDEVGNHSGDEDIVKKEVEEELSDAESDDEWQFEKPSNQTINNLNEEPVWKHDQEQDVEQLEKFEQEPLIDNLVDTSAAISCDLIGDQSQSIDNVNEVSSDGDTPRIIPDVVSDGEEAQNQEDSARPESAQSKESIKILKPGTDLYTAVDSYANFMVTGNTNPFYTETSELPAGENAHLIADLDMERQSVDEKLPFGQPVSSDDVIPLMPDAPLIEGSVSLTPTFVPESAVWKDEQQQQQQAEQLEKFEQEPLIDNLVDTSAEIQPQSVEDKLPFGQPINSEEVLPLIPDAPVTEERVLLTPALASESSVWKDEQQHVEPIEKFEQEPLIDNLVDSSAAVSSDLIGDQSQFITDVNEPSSDADMPKIIPDVVSDGEHVQNHQKQETARPESAQSKEPESIKTLEPATDLYTAVESYDDFMAAGNTHPLTPEASKVITGAEQMIAGLDMGPQYVEDEISFGQPANTEDVPLTEGTVSLTSTSESSMWKKEHVEQLEKFEQEPLIDNLVDTSSAAISSDHIGGQIQTIADVNEPSSDADMPKIIPDVVSHGEEVQNQKQEDITRPESAQSKESIKTPNPVTDLYTATESFDQFMTTGSTNPFITDVPVEATAGVNEPSIASLDVQPQSVEDKLPFEQPVNTEIFPEESKETVVAPSNKTKPAGKPTAKTVKSPIKPDAPVTKGRVSLTPTLAPKSSPTKPEAPKAGNLVNGKGATSALKSAPKPASAAAPKPTALKAAPSVTKTTGSSRVGATSSITRTTAPKGVNGIETKASTTSKTGTTSAPRVRSAAPAAPKSTVPKTTLPSTTSPKKIPPMGAGTSARPSTAAATTRVGAPSAASKLAGDGTSKPASNLMRARPKPPTMTSTTAKAGVGSDIKKPAVPKTTTLSAKPTTASRPPTARTATTQSSGTIGSTKPSTTTKPPISRIAPKVATDGSKPAGTTLSKTAPRTATGNAAKAPMAAKKVESSILKSKKPSAPAPGKGDSTIKPVKSNSVKKPIPATSEKAELIQQSNLSANGTNGNIAELNAVNGGLNGDHNGMNGETEKQDAIKENGVHLDNESAEANTTAPIPSSAPIENLLG